MAHRQFDRYAQSEHDSQYDDMPDLDPAAVGEDGKGDGLQHFEYLGGQHHAMAVEAVGPDAGYRSEQQNWHIGGETQHAQQGRRPGEFIDQPVHRNLLDPVTDQRNGLAGGEISEIAVAQRAQWGGHGSAILGQRRRCGYVAAGVLRSLS